MKVAAKVETIKTVDLSLSEKEAEDFIATLKLMKEAIKEDYELDELEAEDANFYNFVKELDYEVKQAIIQLELKE